MSIITTATKADLDSLATIVARAFHKTNQYFRTTFPDTPLMRGWWKEIFLDAIQDPTYQVLIVRSHEGSKVDAVMLLHRGARIDVFKRHAPTADHDGERWQALVAGVDEKEDGVVDGSFLVIELLGVDVECQGGGLGMELVRDACRVADAEGLDVWVSANLKAKAFYEKCGFVCDKVLVLPGEDQYGQAKLVYRSMDGKMSEVK